MADSPRIEELRRRVRLDPASIAFAALAEEYRRLGRYEEAIATCRAGLQRHPAYLSARVTLGRSLLETGQFDEARAELEHVLKIAPENLAAIRGLAEIHSRRKEHADSTAALAPSEHEEVAAEAPTRTEPGVLDRADQPQTQIQPPIQPAIRPSTVAPATREAPAEEAPALAKEALSHPDYVALPALEAFLDAIERARARATAVDGAARDLQLTDR